MTCVYCFRIIILQNGCVADTFARFFFFNCTRNPQGFSMFLYLTFLFFFSAWRLGKRFCCFFFFLLFGFIIGTRKLRGTGSWFSWGRFIFAFCFIAEKRLFLGSSVALKHQSSNSIFVNTREGALGHASGGGGIYFDVGLVFFPFDLGAFARLVLFLVTARVALRYDDGCTKRDTQVKNGERASKVTIRVEIENQTTSTTGGSKTNKKLEGDRLETFDTVEFSGGCTRTHKQTQTRTASCFSCLFWFNFGFCFFFVFFLDSFFSFPVFRYQYCSLFFIIF